MEQCDPGRRTGFAADPADRTGFDPTTGAPFMEVRLLSGTRVNGSSAASEPRGRRTASRRPT